MYFVNKSGDSLTEGELREVFASRFPDTDYALAWEYLIAPLLKTGRAYSTIQGVISAAYPLLEHLRDGYRVELEPPAAVDEPSQPTQRVVWKYPLSVNGGTLKLPTHDILAVREDAGALALYACVDPNSPLEPVNFRVFGTGEYIPPGLQLAYLDTIQLVGLTAHVFTDR